MPRRPRIHLDGAPSHIVRREHSREPGFFGEEDYQAYLYWLGEALSASMKRNLAALNLAKKDLARLTARLIPVHGRNAPVIHRILGHVDLSLAHVLSRQFWSEELPDAWRMGRATYLLLSERTDE